jgi:hypothetical protein
MENGEGNDEDHGDDIVTRPSHGTNTNISTTKYPRKVRRTRCSFGVAIHEIMPAMSE